jgi:hypothetical protein
MLLSGEDKQARGNICIHIYMYIYICIHIYIYPSPYLLIQTLIIIQYYAGMYVNVQVCINIHMFMYVDVYIYGFN